MAGPSSSPEEREELAKKLAEELAKELATTLRGLAERVLMTSLGCNDLDMTRSYPLYDALIPGVEDHLQVLLMERLQHNRQDVDSQALLAREQWHLIEEREQLEKRQLHERLMQLPHSMRLQHLHAEYSISPEGLALDRELSRMSPEQKKQRLLGLNKSIIDEATRRFG
jgi:hypothetical protein